MLGGGAEALFSRANKAFGGLLNIWKRTLSAIRRLSRLRRRSLVSVWIVPIRRCYRRQDATFRNLSAVKLWIKESERDKYNDDELANADVAFHIMPDAIRTAYMIFAVFWFLFFFIGGSFFTNEQREPVQAVFTDEASY